MRIHVLSSFAELIVCQELYVDPGNGMSKVAILVSLPGFLPRRWDSFGFSSFDVTDFLEMPRFLGNYGFTETAPKTHAGIPSLR